MRSGLQLQKLDFGSVPATYYNRNWSAVSATYSPKEARRSSVLGAGSHSSAPNWRFNCKEFGIATQCSSVAVAHAAMDPYAADAPEWMSLARLKGRSPLEFSATFGRLGPANKQACKRSSGRLDHRISIRYGSKVDIATVPASP